MKILFLFLFLISCSSINPRYDSKNEALDFNKNLTFDEFDKLLIKYVKSSPYPNINR